MPSLPEKVRPGAPIRAESFNTLIDYCRSITVRGDNKTAKANRTPGGTTLSSMKQGAIAASAGGGDEIKIAEVKSKNNTWQYVADIYSVVDANGQPTGTPDETDSTIKVLKDTLYSGETINNGTVLQVRKIDFGGTEYWTVVEHVGAI